jgi:hypothetical protein
VSVLFGLLAATGATAATQPLPVIGGCSTFGGETNERGVATGAALGTGGCRSFASAGVPGKPGK